MKKPLELEIYPKKISPLELRLLCATFLDAALRFYEDPANMERFYRWQNKGEVGLADGQEVGDTTALGASNLPAAADCGAAAGTV